MTVTFDNTFKICTKALLMFRAHPSVPFNVKWIPLLLIRYCSVGYVFLSLIYSSFYEDYIKICTNTAIAILCMTICFHQVTLLKYKDILNELIRTTEKDLIRSETLDPEDRLFVIDYTKRGKNLSKIWFIDCMLAFVFFLLGPIISTIYSIVIGDLKLVHIVEAIYPDRLEEIKNRTDIVLALWSMQIIFLSSAVMCYTGFNSIVTIFTLHACGQVKIVVRQLGELFADEQVDNVIIKAKIKDIVRHVQDIYRFVDLLQQTQTVPYELCLKTSTICIPVTCIGVIEAYEQGNVNFQQVGLVCGFLLQCYIPCYYCDQLQQKGEELHRAVYECGWERHCEKTIRSSMLLLLMSTSRPLVMRALFSDVSLYSFKNVCHQAYSVFNIMYAART